MTDSRLVSARFLLVAQPANSRQLNMGDIMAKGTAQGTQSGAAAPSNSVADTVEQQVVAFAEQLGRIVGTVQAKAEGWLDRDALKEQISHVRDSASALLEQLGVQKSKTPAAAKSAGRNRGRSGGVVDAPGKKHRKPTANVARPNASARANAADAGRIAKMKAGNASHRRGRG
jgi:hypothetical protein